MKYEEDLLAIIKANSNLMEILKLVRSMDLDEWIIGAGMLRDIVWSHLHECEIPKFKDVDVAYYDKDADRDFDKKIERILAEIRSDIPWDVTNQAFVHEWYGEEFGFEVRPLESIMDAIATWPETTTCVGISLTDDDEILVYAPYGLDDLFEMKLRWNPTRVKEEEFWRRLKDKDLRNKWEKMVVIGN